MVGAVVLMRSLKNCPDRFPINEAPHPRLRACDTAAVADADGAEDEAAGTGCVELTLVASDAMASAFSLFCNPELSGGCLFTPQP